MERFYAYKKKTDKIITKLLTSLTVTVIVELFLYIWYAFVADESLIKFFIEPFIPLITNLYWIVPTIIISTVICVFLSLLAFYGIETIKKKLEDR